MRGLRGCMNISCLVNVISNISFFSSKIIHIGEINSFPLYSKANFIQRCPINFFGEHKYMLASDESSDMKNYYETLVPLLYETWLEVLPEEKKVNTSEGKYGYVYVVIKIVVS